MRAHSSVHVALSALCVLVVAGPTRADPPKDATPQQGRKAVERGLDFLQKDAAKWRKDRECSTCHHGTMTVWALAEAKSRGYDVAAETLTETAKWTKDRLDRIDLPHDTRPGWGMVNTPALYLSMMALCVPKQDVVSADELKRIAAHLLRHQETDGSWACEDAANRDRAVRGPAEQGRRVGATQGRPERRLSTRPWLFRCFREGEAPGEPKH